MNNPKCSFCGYELDDEETWYTMDVENGDCDMSTLKCPNLDCQKTFHVICVHEIRWRCCDEDGDELE